MREATSMNGVTFTSGTSSTSGSNSERDVRGFSVVEILIALVIAMGVDLIFTMVSTTYRHTIAGM